MEMVSSSTNFVKPHLNNSNTQLKQELLRLGDSFDRKFNELIEIREQMKKIINDLT
jgi:hypothetical protein